MTISERSRLESFNSHAISEGKLKRGIGAVDGLMASHGQGVTFADSMYSITAQNVDAWTSEDDKEVQKTAVVDRICKTPMQKLLYYAREKWTDESFYTFDSSSRGYSVNEEALSAVREQLRSEGINPNTRTPTHEITDEQMEWLNSKYDLKYLSECSISEPEFGNFMLDLAYMNVFSLAEVSNMFAGTIPPLSDKPQLVSIYYYGDPETGEGAGYVSQISGDTLSYEEWLEERLSITAGNYIKAENPGLTDEEYQEMTAGFIAQHKERMDIIHYIFEFASERFENNTTNTLLKINDASEQLKEDFGSRP